MICPNCNNNIQNNINVCNYCGINITQYQQWLQTQNSQQITNTYTQQPQRQAQIQPNNQNITRKFCPNCNREIPYTSRVCMWCKYNLVPTQQQNQNNIQYQQTNNQAYMQYQSQYYGNMPQQKVQAYSANVFYYIAVIFGILSSVLCVISVILPFYTVETWGYSNSITLTEGSDGFFIAGIALVGLLASMPSKKQWQMGISHLIIALIIGAVIIYKVNSVETDNIYTEYGGFIHRGSGCYLAFVGIICLLITGILFSVARNLRKQNKGMIK